MFKRPCYCRSNNFFYKKMDVKNVRLQMAKTLLNANIVGSFLVGISLALVCHFLTRQNNVYFAECAKPNGNVSYKIRIRPYIITYFRGSAN